MKNNKVFGILAFVLVVVAIAGGIWYYETHTRPTQPPTTIPTGEVAYHDAIYGYSLYYYPSTFSYQVNTSLYPGIDSVSFDDPYGFSPFWAYAAPVSAPMWDAVINLSTAKISTSSVEEGGATWERTQRTYIPQDGIGTFAASLEFVTVRDGVQYLLECADSCDANNFPLGSSSSTWYSDIFSQMFSSFSFGQPSHAAFGVH